jgi:hypothetical protein
MEQSPWEADKRQLVQRFEFHCKECLLTGPPTTGPCPEPEESSFYHLVFLRHCLILSFHPCLGLHIFRQEFRMHISSLPCVLYSLPIMSLIFIALVIFGKQYELCSFPMSCYLYFLFFEALCMTLEVRTKDESALHSKFQYVSSGLVPFCAGWVSTS